MTGVEWFEDERFLIEAIVKVIWNKREKKMIKISSKFGAEKKYQKFSEVFENFVSKPFKYIALVPSFCVYRILGLFYASFTSNENPNDYAYFIP